MTEKEKLLNEAITQLYDLGFGDLNDTELLNTLLAEEVMAIGTAIDEKFYSISEVKDLIRRQKEQTAGMDMSYGKKELFRYFEPGANDALIVDDLTLYLNVNGEKLEIYFRFSTVLKFRASRWQVLHFHASKPENVETATDTFGIDEWKKKTEELEKLVVERTAELSQKNQQLNETIQQLTTTQAQLIQSEKMASLGELTAGIAHEIQNPLNFVNNFSEVSNELIDEMKEQLAIGNKQQAIAIGDDIKQNLEKINHHGKRADDIVKGMLQHSRTSSGQKEPTDINALCDEYLRLAYHGFRAKDKSFNVNFETGFDPSLPKINAVPQDIGRAVLNLINNAFYAVNEKQQQNIPGYEPAVSVGTKKNNDKVEISVIDNGNGISQTILDKVFQPFFTTKPTGKGTGLGLSLAYEIVKAHGGELRVDTKLEGGTMFTILIPV